MDIQTKYTLPLILTLKLFTGGPFPFLSLVWHSSVLKYVATYMYSHFSSHVPQNTFTQVYT